MDPIPSAVMTLKPAMEHSGRRQEFADSYWVLPVASGARREGDETEAVTDCEQIQRQRGAQSRQVSERIGIGEGVLACSLPTSGVLPRQDNCACATTTFVAANLTPQHHTPHVRPISTRVKGAWLRLASAQDGELTRAPYLGSLQHGHVSDVVNQVHGGVRVGERHGGPVDSKG